MICTGHSHVQTLHKLYSLHVSLKLHSFYRQNHATSTSNIDAWSSPLAHPHLDLNERKPFGTFFLGVMQVQRLTLTTHMFLLSQNGHRNNNHKMLRLTAGILSIWKLNMQSFWGNCQYCYIVLSLQKEDLPGTPWSWHGGCNDHRMCPTKSLIYGTHTHTQKKTTP